MQIRKATPENIDAMLTIITLAKEGLAALFVNQWQDGYPNRTQLVADIESGNSYLGFFEDEICATAMISFEADPNYAVIENGAWSQNAPYCVVHRIAVHPSYRNKHCAAQMLAYAENLCAARKINYLRIDTHLDNYPMRNFLTRNHFRQCGTIFLDGKNDAAHARVAYDKII